MIDKGSKNFERNIKIFLICVFSLLFLLTFFPPRKHLCNDKEIGRTKQKSIKGSIVNKNHNCTKTSFTLVVKTDASEESRIDVDFGFACLYADAEKGDEVIKRENEDFYLLIKKNTKSKKIYTMNCERDCMCKYGVF